jgi:3-methylcrotonyl-CoA carboxylase alpha subunit
MTGVVLKVNVAVGTRVKAGDATIVMESMKMELRIASEVDGVVTAVHYKPGETVERNAIVAVVEPNLFLQCPRMTSSGTRRRASAHHERVQHEATRK